MDKRGNKPSIRIGITGFLGIALIALKLIGIINWPWVLVLTPIWLPNLMIIIALMLVAIFKQGRR